MDKALEAVLDWLVATDSPDFISQEHYEQQAREVVTAYLSALPATDTSGLVERLRSLADCDARAGEPLGKCMREAADRIEALEREKAEAKAVLDMLVRAVDHLNFGKSQALDDARSYLEGRK